MKKTTVLFVCMGNICRSPTAEGVFCHMVEHAGLAGRVLADSAGTHDYHIGKEPDRRMQRAAAARGYDLSTLRGRQVSLRDFDEFDYILAMDRDNLANLQRMCPPQHAYKIGLFLDFSARFSRQEVPDPYFGGAQGFKHVVEMVEDAAHGLLEKITREAGGPRKA